MDLPNLSVDNVFFPDRKSIVRSEAHLTDVISEVKKIDVTKIDFEGEDFVPLTKIIQKQKVYFWIRLFIRNEIDIKPETKVIMDYDNGKEILETYFMYFGKKGLERDEKGQIVNFNPEDDRKILCLLIDTERIDVNNQDLPYIKTLFPLGKFFRPQYIRKIDFCFKLESGEELDFYDIDF